MQQVSALKKEEKTEEPEKNKENKTLPYKNLVYCHVNDNSKEVSSNVEEEEVVYFTSHEEYTKHSHLNKGFPNARNRMRTNNTV